MRSSSEPLEFTVKNKRYLQILQIQTKQKYLKSNNIS